jgi:hypothetical protein
MTTARIVPALDKVEYGEMGVSLQPEDLAMELFAPLGEPYRLVVGTPVSLPYDVPDSYLNVFFPLWRRLRYAPKTLNVP